MKKCEKVSCGISSCIKWFTSEQKRCKGKGRADSFSGVIMVPWDSPSSFRGKDVDSPNNTHWSPWNGSDPSLRVKVGCSDERSCPAGRDFSHDETLDVPTQVELLIKQATSHENLCQCYIGWSVPILTILSRAAEINLRMIVIYLLICLLLIML